MCDILDQGKISYIKWDMNSSIIDVYSAENSQGKVTYDYVLGVYDFLEKLLQRYPDILMEAGLPLPMEQKEYPAYQIELVREQ